MARSDRIPKYSEIYNSLDQGLIERGFTSYTTDNAADVYTALIELTKGLKEQHKGDKETVKNIDDAASEIIDKLDKLFSDNSRKTFYESATQNLATIENFSSSTANNTNGTWEAIKAEAGYLGKELPRIEHGAVKAASAGMVVADVIARIERDVNIIAKEYGAESRPLVDVKAELEKTYKSVKQGMGSSLRKAQKDALDTLYKAIENGRDNGGGTGGGAGGGSDNSGGSGGSDGTGGSGSGSGSGGGVKATEGVERLKELKAAEARRKKDAEQQQKRDEATREKTNTVIKMAVDEIKKVVDKIFGWYKDAFSKIQETYNNNFTNITTKLNLTAAEYSQVYRDTAKQLRDARLDTQFDTADYIESFNATLNTGLRGQMARDKAMSDLILKRLIPTIDTNSNTYILGYKTFGESYPKIIQGMYRLNTLMGKTVEYYDSQTYQTTAANFEKLMAGMGWSEEEMANFHNALNSYAELYGLDATDQLVSTFNQALKSGEINTSLALALQQGAIPDNLLKLLQTNAVDTINKITGTSTGVVGLFNNQHKLIGTNIASEAGLLPTDAATAIYNASRNTLIAPTEGVSREELLGYSSDWERSLANGMYASETYKFEKMFNNQQALVDVATWMAENIPNKIQDLITAVVQGAWSIVTAIIGMKLFGTVGSGLTGLIKSALTGGGTEGASIFGGGSSALSLGSGGLVGGSASGAAVAGSTVAALAGTIMQGVDIYNSVSNTYGETNSALKATGAGLSRFLGTSDYMWRDFSHQVENSNFDVGDMLSSGAEHGLILGGISGIIGGPAVGAIVGAASGILTAGKNAISQLIEKADVRDYLKGFDVVSEAAKVAAEGLNTFNESTTKLSHAQEISLRLQEEDNATLAEGTELSKLNNDDLAYLQSVYPDYFQGMTDATGASSAYAEALDILIKKEQEKTQAELEASYNEAIAELDNADLRTVGAAFSPELYKALTSLQSNDTAGLASVAEQFGFANADAMVDMLNRSYEHGNLVNYDASKGTWNLAKDFWGNYKINSAINLSGGFDKEAQTDTILRGLTAWNSLANIVELATQRATLAPSSYKTEANDLQIRLDDLRSMYSAIGRADYYKSLFEGNDKTSQAIQAFNALPDSIPELDSLRGYALHYQLGTQFITGETFALLHHGEAVSTAGTVDRLLNAVESSAKATMELVKVQSVAEKEPQREIPNRQAQETQISVETIIMVLKEISSKLGNSPMALMSALSGNNYSDSFLSFRGENI